MNFATLLATGPRLTAPANDRRTNPSKMTAEVVLQCLPGDIAHIVARSGYTDTPVRRILRTLIKAGKVKAVNLRSLRGGKKLRYELT